MILAVGKSQGLESATKSPKDDILSAPRALAYAVASGVNELIMSSTWHSLACSGVSGTPTAAPAGLTCLKDVAAGKFKAVSSSLTNCQAFRASQRLM